MNANDTVIICRSDLWTVDTTETAEAFEDRILATIESRSDTLRLAVAALVD